MVAGGLQWLKGGWCFFFFFFLMVVEISDKEREIDRIRWRGREIEDFFSR